MLTFRPILTEDIPKLVWIDSLSNDPSWSQTMFEKELELSQSLHRAALKDEKLVGFGVAWKVKEELQILELAILPEYRRMGTASDLMREFSKESSVAGCVKMVLELRKENGGALKFYEHLGFKQVGARKNFYSSSSNKNSDALLMECDLPLR